MKKYILGAGLLLALPVSAFAQSPSDALAASEACARLHVIAQDHDRLQNREPGYKADFPNLEHHPAYSLLAQAVISAGRDVQECIDMPLHKQILSRMTGQ